MKLLLLCLGLTLVCAHEGGHHEVVTSNLDMSKLEGEWYTVMLASKDLEIIKEETGSMSVYLEYIQLLANSSLLLKYHSKDNGECTKIYLIANPTEEKGVYSVAYDGQNLMYFLETVVDEYLFVSCVNFKNGVRTNVMELYGRNADLRSNTKERFEKLCLQLDIPQENILDVTTRDRCLYNRSGNNVLGSSAV